MKISSNKSRLNHITEIAFCALSDLSMVDYPGSTISCSGDFETIPFQSCDFMESEPANGEQVEQEISIVVPASGQEMDDFLNNISSNYGVLKLVYSNGDSKLLGSNDNPVLLTMKKTGILVKQTLYAKRFSAEKAKYII